MNRAQTAGKLVGEAYAGTANAWKINMQARAGIMKFSWKNKTKNNITGSHT